MKRYWSKVDSQRKHSTKIIFVLVLKLEHESIKKKYWKEKDEKTKIVFFLNYIWTKSINSKIPCSVEYR